MDWTVIGAPGELVGAAAVVISLLYVGRELKHSSTVARVQGIQSTNEKLFDWALLIGSDPELWPRLKPNFPPDYAAWLEGRYNLPGDPAGGA